MTCRTPCTWTMSSQGLVVMRTWSTITVIHINSLASAGMNLRQWTTNSSKLKEKLVAESTIATDKPKVLSLEWDSNADTISFPLMKVVSETKVLHHRLTKRSILSIAAKVFGPLGLLAPFTVRAKVMLQELWKQKVSWYSQLLEELKPH